MNLSLIRSMTRSAVFELENGKCFRPEHPFAVALNGKTIYESCNTNVFSLFSLTPSTAYTVEVDTEGEHLKLDFTTEAESFFVDASRYGLVADGETDIGEKKKGTKYSRITEDCGEETFKSRIEKGKGEASFGTEIHTIPGTGKGRYLPGTGEILFQNHPIL